MLVISQTWHCWPTGKILTRRGWEEATFSGNLSAACAVDFTGEMWDGSWELPSWKQSLNLGHFVCFLRRAECTFTFGIMVNFHSQRSSLLQWSILPLRASPLYLPLSTLLAAIELVIVASYSFFKLVFGCFFLTRLSGPWEQIYCLPSLVLISWESMTVLKVQW